jgi:hypothetical protein
LINAGYAYTAFTYYFDQPTTWRGRLVDYTPRDASAGSVILQTGSIGGDKNLGWNSPESDFYATTAAETTAALDRVFSAHARMWQFRIYDTVVDPGGILRDYLAQRGRIIDDEGFRGESFARAQGYLTSREPIRALPASATARQVLFGNRIELMGFEPMATRVSANAPFDVNLYWQAKEPTNVDSHLYVGLYAEDGSLVAATEEMPIGNALGTSRWTPGQILREPLRLNIPATVAPAEYVLRVMLYNPLTREPLEAQTSGTATSDQIDLMKVRVEK